MKHSIFTRSRYTLGKIMLALAGLWLFIHAITSI